MANTKITSNVIADGAITESKLASGVGGVAGIVSNADATAITIDSSENVGIGTSSPNGKLDVVGDIKTSGEYVINSGTTAKWTIGQSSDELYFYSVSSGSERARIDSAGNFGIGTTSPAAKLHIDSTGAALQFTRTSQETYLIEHGTSGLYTKLGSTIATGITQDHDFGVYSNAGTRYLFCDGSTSRVGIGTSSLGVKLEVNCGADNVAARFTSTDAGSYIQLMDNNATGHYLGTNGNTFLILNTSNVERFRISSGGNVSIATTSTGGNAALTLGSANFTIGIKQFCNNGQTSNSFEVGGTGVGSITHTASSTAYNTSSDYRLKENVVTDWDATTRLKQLRPSRFNFIADADTTVDGFLAHEVQDIVPEAITGQKDAMKEEEYEVTPEVLDENGNVVTEAVWGTRTVPDYQGIDQSKLVPLLTKALQEQQTIIEDLQARIETLENA